MLNSCACWPVIDESSSLVWFLRACVHPQPRAGAKGAPPIPASSVRVGALVFTVPRNFSQHDFRRSGRLLGILVTDYRVDANSSTLTTGTFPSHGVALVLGQAALPEVTARRAAARPLRLPLRLSELRGPQRHADGDAWNGVLCFRGLLYTVSFWAGRTALPDDRAALLDALTAIQPAP